jgi:DNA-binding transcriptional LysR family regulator
MALTNGTTTIGSTPDPADGIGFDLRALHIFVAVCDTGGMTGAAAKLRMTQPAVSQAIRALEQSVGTALFDRSIRPLGLTIAGDLLHERAVRLLEEARQIVPAVRLENRTQLSSIRIGVPDSVSGLLTETLAELLQPEVKHLFMWSGSASVHRAALVSRQLSMIVTNDPMEDFEGFERHELVREPFIRILPTSHAAFANVDIAEMAGVLPLIRYASRAYIGRRVERHLRRLRLELPRSVEVDRTLQVTAMVERGFGWAITTPLCLFEARPDYSRLVIAPLPPPIFSRRLTLVAHREELGRIPTLVAQASRRVLEYECLPRMLPLMPWLADQMRFGVEDG